MKRGNTMYVGTSKQMKRYDQNLLDNGYSIEELVDKASDVILPHCSQYNNIVIMCGPGNNGADGIALGIKLTHLRKQVSIYVLASEDQLSKASKFYVELAKKENIDICFLEEHDIDTWLNRTILADAIVDAMFGFGLHSDPRNIYKTVIEEINKMYDKDIIAIDIPTGLNCDTGIPYQSAVCATKTVTLTALKQAFLNEECQMYTGEVILEQLDVKNLYEEVGLAELVSPSWIKYHLKPRSYYGHKGDYGRILLITGCDHYRGAALLGSRAAVLSGSGVVCVCSTEEVIRALSVVTPECTSMLRPHKIEGGVCNQYDAILIGSGLGLSLEAYQYVQDVLQSANVPVVIDGDALTIVAENKELLKETKAPVVLTPHFGEFKRFVSYADANEMVDLAKAFAREYQVVLVLKGPNTIITDGKDVYRNTTANKTMAVAGMGDVLAGIITSFIGQGYSLKHAAIIATYLHGKCGDEVAKNSYTALPSKIVELIPEQMHTIIEK